MGQSEYLGLYVYVVLDAFFDWGLGVWLLSLAVIFGSGFVGWRCELTFGFGVL